nr:hypothetical protein [Erythrobacter longus]
MALPNLYSRRKRLSSGDVPDVYTHDKIATTVRISLFKTMNRAIGEAGASGFEVWKCVKEVLLEDLGVYRLTERDGRSEEDVETYFSHTAEIDRALDVIELWHAFLIVEISQDRLTRTYKPMQNAVETINARLKESGIGFAIEDGNIMEKSTEFTHVEMTVPALRVLSEKRFAGANEEFRKAHDAYKVGDYKDCISNCLKAFESVMKSIADEQKWGLDPNATAKALINALLDNDYIPAFMQTQFGSLRTFLESGIPTVRNKTSGHGQGAEPVEVPKALAAYQLHQTAAVIVFLAEL